MSDKFPLEAAGVPDSTVPWEKCASMRLGEEFHDLDDVRYLLRYLNIETAETALEIVTRYFDEGQLLPKTRLVLEDLLASPGRAT